MGGKKTKMYGVQLTEEDLDFYQRQLNCDEQDIKDVFKEFIKSSSNGQMTKEQFLTLYKNFFPGEMDSMEFSDQVFRTFDTNNDGFISFREFLFAISVLSIGTPEEKLSMIFHMYDVDGDGIIAKVELIMIVQSIFNMLDYERHTNMLGSDPDTYQDYGSLSKGVNKIFEQLDENGDHKITREEFISGCLKDESLTELLTTDTCLLVGSAD